MTQFHNSLYGKTLDELLVVLKDLVKQGAPTWKLIAVTLQMDDIAQKESDKIRFHGVE